MADSASHVDQVAAGRPRNRPAGWPNACSAAALVLGVAANAIVRVLLGPSCAVCSVGLEQPFDGPICAICRLNVPKLTAPLCVICGEPLASHVVAGPLCRRCEAHRPRYQLRTQRGPLRWRLARDDSRVQVRPAAGAGRTAGGLAGRGRRRRAHGRRCRRARAATPAARARTRIQPGGRPCTTARSACLARAPTRAPRTPAGGPARPGAAKQRPARLRPEAALAASGRATLRRAEASERGRCAD